MKRIMTLDVKIELSADSVEGIAAAAMEAQAYLKCDIAFHTSELGAYGAKLIEKSSNQPDEMTLLDIVLETTGISDKNFIKSQSWECAQARYLFAFYAKKYLEWNWRRVSTALERDRTTVTQGVKGLVDLIAGHPGATRKASLHIRNQRALVARESMERIQRKWCEAKK